MANPFDSVPVPRKGRTNFNESHSLSGTFPLSKLVPIFFTPTLPGDKWNIDLYNLSRLETLIAPAMQQVNASVLWFKMPQRLLFKHFKKWYSGGENGDDTHEKPHIHLYDFAQSLMKYLSQIDMLDFTEEFFGPGSLWNYLGLPVPIKYDTDTGVWSVRSIEEWDDESDVGSPDSDFIDLMPLMAYNYLYDTFFMDQTLNDRIFVEGEEGNFTINKGFEWHGPDLTYYFGPQDSAPASSEVFFYSSGNDISEGGDFSSSPGDVMCLLNLFNRAWKKDYFTSALPTPQRGPEVTVRLTETTAPVTSTLSGSIGIDSPIFMSEDEDHVYDNDAALLNSGAQGSGVLTDGTAGGDVRGISGTLVSQTINGTADLSGLSPITITALRNLFKLQAFLEKNNVGGGRYIETILAHWAERVPDFTVQRPQFIRATSLPIQINEVTATANSVGVNSVVGDLAGKARTEGNLGKVRIYTHEPNFIFGLYCVTAPGSYAGQGIPRVFQHVTRYDEPWTDFQHIGEQAIKMRELYFPFEDASLKDVDFGYQQRFSEYKFMPNRIVGDFQTSLAYWHMARMFDQPPYLNGDFVSDCCAQRTEQRLTVSLLLLSYKKCALHIATHILHYQSIALAFASRYFSASGFHRPLLALHRRSSSANIGSVLPSSSKSEIAARGRSI